MNKDKVKEFMNLLYEELERGYCGMIDPIDLKEDTEYHNDLEKVFIKTFKKFKI